MNHRALKTFLSVAESGSIRAAAKALFVSQPAVTRTIRELEEDLGVPLVTRSTNGIELTEYGKMLRIRANLVIEESRRAREELNQLKRTLTGSVRVGVAATAAMVILPRAFQAFRAGMPDIDLLCVDGSPPSTLPELRNGNLDLLLTPLTPDQIDQDLHCEILLNAPLTVVVRAKHPLITSRTLAGLQHEEWLSWDAQLVRSIFETSGLASPERLVITQSFAVALGLLTQTNVVTLFTTPLANLAQFDGVLQAIDVREPLPNVTLSVVTRRKSPLTPAAEFFVEQVRSAAGTVAASVSKGGGKLV